jgi:DNA-binding MarR family transcriptional regulator
MMSKRQHVVNNEANELALLVADIYEAAGVLRRSGESIAGAEGQSQARWQLLSVISAGPITVAQAARRLGVTRQGVQRVANDLIGEQLAVTGPNPNHRNSPLLELTSAGEATLSRINERAQTLNATIARKLNPAAVVRTRAALRTLIEATSVSS